MIRPEHPFDIRPDLRKVASTKAESTKAVSVIRPNQLVRNMITSIKGFPVKSAPKIKIKKSTCKVKYFNKIIKYIQYVLIIENYSIRFKFYIF
jgi:hypothetical protein